MCCRKETPVGNAPAGIFLSVTIGNICQNSFVISDEKGYDLLHNFRDPAISVDDQKRKSMYSLIVY